MPIRIPDALPATEVLESENIFVMTEHRAIHQDSSTACAHLEFDAPENRNRNPNSAQALEYALAG